MCHMRLPETVTAVLTLFCLSCSGGILVKEDQSTFRSPTLSSPSMMIEGRMNSLKKVWQKRFLTGVSSNIIVFRGTAIIPLLNGEIVAVRLNDGVGVGRKKMGKGPVTNPILQSDKLYFTLPRSRKQLASYDMVAGKFEWRRILPKGSDFMVADEHRLFVVAGREIVAMSQTDGSKLWQKNEDNPISSTLLSLKKGLVYNDRRGTLVCRESESGELRWKRILSSGMPYGSPLSLDETLIVTTLSGMVSALNVRDGTIIWEKSVGYPIYTSPVIKDDLVVVAPSSGDLKALRLENGETVWTLATGELLTQPVMIESTDYMVLSTQKGEIYIVNITDGGQILNEKLDARVMVVPAISGDFLLIADDRKQVTAYQIIRETPPSYDQES